MRIADNLIDEHEIIKRLSGKKYIVPRLRNDFFENKEVIEIEKIKYGYKYLLLYLEMFSNSLYLEKGKRVFFDTHRFPLEDIYEYISITFTTSANICEIKKAFISLRQHGFICFNKNMAILKDFGVNLRNRASFEYKQWVKAVFERDNYTCKKCQVRGTYLNAHHIKEFAKYPDLRFDIANGITLCKECHKEEHRGRRHEQN